MDARLRGVEWKDLRALSRAEVAHELLISTPWLAGSLLFFLTSLRQVHNAHHYTLGLPRLATDGVMLMLSVAMLGSMHAVQTNHLRHHRFCLEDEDAEGASARLPAWRAIVAGPLFPIRLHREALAVACLRYHVAAMAAGLISYDMFFHVEHHLYPAVPTRRLTLLARRLDAVAPELAARRVF